MENGFIILDFEEDLNDYIKSFDTNTFNDLHLENTSWKCKIKKLNEGKLFELLCKYEKQALEFYDERHRGKAPPMTSLERIVEQAKRE